MIIVTHIGQTGAGRAFESVKGLRVRARKSRCTLKIKSERTNERLEFPSEKHTDKRKFGFNQLFHAHRRSLADWSKCNFFAPLVPSVVFVCLF